MRLSLDAGASRMVSAQQLEEGAADLEGRFGAGQGKWRLFVTSSAPLEVMSLMQTPTGHLTNLSGSSLNGNDLSGDSGNDIFSPGDDDGRPVPSSLRSSTRSRFEDG